ncbi:hypothetical protein E2977_04210 (plasmid) [Paracoccus yeei]|uniref:Uncharacterized protein n=1 Tax=Paracoccus yeei TaxID=147645 RepID=A0A5P2QLL2_9RHOB|nr:hypothetical protein FOB51_01985 [Paracoccus yeei]
MSCPRRPTKPPPTRPQSRPRRPSRSRPRSATVPPMRPPRPRPSRSLRVSRAWRRFPTYPIRSAWAPACRNPASCA